MKYSISRNLHTDFSVFEQNKLPERSYFIPFSSVKALKKSDYLNERYVSDRVQILSGEWDFAYFDKLSGVPDEFDADALSFDRVTVPSTWQRTGYDQIAYINCRYPFPKRPPDIPADVPVGIYRKKFDVENAQARRVLTFLGVAGALAVYINGEYIAYSEGSHNSAEFYITPYLKEGENELLAVVYKWSNGTYLECQDMFRENGIFRDVYITVFKSNYISDFQIKTKKNIDSTYDLDILVEGVFSRAAKITVCVTDGKDTYNASLLPDKKVSFPSLYVDEWTAETPKLYEAVMTLYNDGEEAEAIRAYIGFRDIEIQGEIFLYNGKAIKMKGVNHHDTHMTKGYAMGISDMEKDVSLMKQYNCNTVRTSHYPPDPVFLTLCDFYGLYVIDEADIETHGFYAVPGSYRPGKLSNDPDWADHYLDRVKRMYGRDKNHPCITMWSLGNESGGYVCQDICYNYLKKVNPEIPVHYEGVIRSKRWAYDVVSRMYAPPQLMRDILNGKAGKKYKGKPFFQCEYAHAMGNGPGGLEEYMQIFNSSEQFLGGCIWEWADHSVYDENAKYKWTYGGDHNEPIHDGNFCVDGLFYPNREPSSGALEMKAVYRPVRAGYVGDDCFEFWNTNTFISTDYIDIVYDIMQNGSVLRSGLIQIDIPPEDKHIFNIDRDACAIKDEDIFVNFTYKDRNTGYEIAKEQIVVSRAPMRKKSRRDNAVFNEAKKEISIDFENGSARFDKKKGLVSLRCGGAEYVNPSPRDGAFGFVPHIFRGVLDNDKIPMIGWSIAGMHKAKAKLYSCKLITDDSGKTAVRTSFKFITRKIFTLAKAEVDYCFNDNGTVYVTVRLKKSNPLTVNLPRFGVHLEMPSDFEETEYYGLGPAENYSDFKEHCALGIYKIPVTEMAHKYIKPQDSGNRGETRYASIGAGADKKIVFYAIDKPFNFNANHFTLEEMKAAKHIEDLPDTDTTFVSIDGFVRGTGSGSCGPQTAKEHTIPFGFRKPLEFTFEINTREG